MDDVMRWNSAHMSFIIFKFVIFNGLVVVPCHYSIIGLDIQNVSPLPRFQLFKVYGAVLKFDKPQGSILIKF